MVDTTGTILPNDLNVSEKFCAAPFSGVLIEPDGGLRPCCDFIGGESTTEYIYVKEYDRWWNQGLDQLRKSMISGPPDGGCGHCLAKEDNPKETHQRKITNFRVVNSLGTILQDYGAGKVDSPSWVEIRLGNVCNLGCIMCDPSLSSMLATERYQHQAKFADIDIPLGKVNPAPWWKDPDSWETALSLIRQARFLNLSGGEPFMHPKIFDLLGVVSSRCERLSANTNLTLLDQPILDALAASPAKKLLMIGSLEGIGAHNDYVRYPSKWSVIADNLTALKKICQIQINHTLQHTSVYTLPALLDWSHTQGLPISFGRVYQRSVDRTGMITQNSVSPVDHERFSNWLAGYNGPYKEVTEKWAQTYRFDINLHQRFRRYVQTLDSIRGTDFNATFQPTWIEP